jgi:D-psicose/D-tagatose/L-ribulose 3-epimerase
MKLGFNLLLWTGFVTEEHFPLISKIKKAGFDGVELPIFGGDPDHYAKIGEFLRSERLGATAVTVVPDEQHSPISPDPAVRAAALDRLKWAVDCAAAAGAETLLGPFHSPLGVFTGSGPTEDEKSRAAEVHRALADYAQQKNVVLALEYLNRFECYFLTTMADAVAHVKRVNHPNFGTMYDTFHANIEEKDPVGIIRGAIPYLRHVHISENDRGTPGTGHVNFVEVTRALRKGGYDGWLTIEAFGRALPDLAAATRVWRDFFPNPDEVYTKGGRLVRRLWNAAGPKKKSVKAKVKAKAKPAAKSKPAVKSNKKTTKKRRAVARR